MLLQTAYLHNVLALSDRDKTLKTAQAMLKGVEFDVIVVTGVSGLLFGPLLAYTLNEHLLVIRKTGESSHSALSMEGFVPTHGERFLFVDDLIASGDTIRRVATRLMDHPNFKGKCIGAYLFQPEVFLAPSDLTQYFPVLGDEIMQGSCWRDTTDFEWR